MRQEVSHINFVVQFYLMISLTACVLRTLAGPESERRKGDMARMILRVL